MIAPVPRWLPETPDGAAIRGTFLADERRIVARLAEHAAVDAATGAAVAAQARHWVEGVRAEQKASVGVESFLHQYDLSTQEGVLLMCVAEALLRIPTPRPPISSSATSWRAAIGKGISARPTRCSSTHRRGA